jgi:hypothetical protein
MQTTVSDLRRMQAECFTENTPLIGDHDLDGSGECRLSNTSKMALSVLDVSDPENPRLLRQIPHAPNTHNHNVQIVGSTLIQNSEFISYIPRTLLRGPLVP